MRLPDSCEDRFRAELLSSDLDLGLERDGFADTVDLDPTDLDAREVWDEDRCIVGRGDSGGRAPDGRAWDLGRPAAELPPYTRAIEATERRRGEGLRCCRCYA